MDSAELATDTSAKPGSPMPARSEGGKHCHGCGHWMHASAPTCPSCGAPQPGISAVTTRGRVGASPAALQAGHVYCRGCGAGVHQTAVACPHCGAPQATASASLHADGGHGASAAAPWLGIVSLVLGVLCILALFDDGHWDRDSIVGFFSLALPGLVMGIAAIATQAGGRGMAVTGIVLSTISLLVGIGQIQG